MVVHRTKGRLAAAMATCVAALGTAQAQDLLRWLDRDGDGAIGAHEGAEAMLYLTEVADVDGDGAVTPEEIRAFLAGEEDEHHAITEMIEMEVRGILEEFDEDGDGAISIRGEAPRSVREDLAELDQDGDGQVTADELRALLADELRGAEFEVVGTRALMHGTIGASTPARVLELILEHPEVDTLVLTDVPGSMDDEANLRAARLVRQRGFTTVVPYDGMVASGGVDFFLAGAVRRAGPHARIGVHSWSAGPDGEQGGDLPRDHPEHEMFVEYYADMGTHPEFYWFTLEAAPAEDVHWMTVSEIEEYGLVTEPWNFDDEVLPPGDPYGLEAIDVSSGSRGIVPLPEGVDPILREHFDRYARVLAPNGRPIHILAQPPWTEDQIVHARNVLAHILTDAPGTEFGHDKSVVANAMTDRRATLVLFATQDAMEEALHGPLGELELGMQDLRANECPAIGSPDYLAHDTRDASYEEILHLVHQHGIRPALPQYDALLQLGNDAAAAADLWDAWPEEEPGSHRYEYIAAAYDNYLDLWTVQPTRYEGHPLDEGDVPDGTSHFGTFRAGSRALMQERIPEAHRLCAAFFPEHLTYTAELPEDFEGTFFMDLRPELRYTTKSQHLRRVSLRGDRPAGIVGNAAENVLGGNDGDNVLEGGAGDDQLSGGDGVDVAVFRGPQSDYRIENRGDTLQVSDTRSQGDGTDTLTGIEVLRFADGEKDLRD